MKKVLFLTPRLPYPPIGGDRLKNYWMLNILSKYFNVHLVSITDKYVPKDFYDWINNLGISYKIFKKNKINFYINALKFITNSLPIQVNYFFYKDIKSYVDSIYNEFDLLISTLIRTSEYIIDKNKPKILDMADSIALNYIRSKKMVQSFKWKLIYTIEFRRLINYEIRCVERFDKILLFNKEEVDYFQNPNKVVWIPHGVNEQLLKYQNVNAEYKNSIVFFGKMDYQPNIDAVLWFTENVMPYIDKRITFTIVGAYPTKEIKNLQKKYKNIKVTGYVEDPYQIIQSSLCVVAPMQTGAGIQNKVLESMALGTINIVSSLAAKPIGAIHERDFLIIDNPREIANRINDIFMYPERYHYLKINSREFIKNNFTWDIYEKKLLQIIEEVLNDSKSTSTT